MGMADRPEVHRFMLGYGRVQRVHADTWEVDVLDDDGGLTPRVLVVGARLPEASTIERPQWVAVGFIGAATGQPVCWTVESRLPGPRFPRKDFVYYDEVLNFRRTIDRAGNFELRNKRGDIVARIRIEENGPKIFAEVPGVSVALDGSDKSLRVHCDGDLVATVGADATVQAEGALVANAGGDATLHADGDATVDAGGDVTLQNDGGARIQLTGNQVMIN